MQMTTKMTNYSVRIKWLSIATIAASLLVFLRVLPIEQGFELLRMQIAGLGLWGPVVFGLVYIVAALLFVPGSALTIMAGAVFGLGLGTVTVSVASTIAAALGFLIARYFARDAVAAKARANPKFFAIDEAIRQGDWRIVGMLRLSPAIPFSLSNYLYGLTPVRFWPYVAASWIAMLPGTFMYVYVAHVGTVGLSAAAQGGSGRSAGQWALLIIGLVATIAVTVYVTRLARQSIQQYATIPTEDEAAAAPVVAVEPAGGWPAGTVIVAVVALTVAAAAGVAYANRDAVRAMFKPPQVELRDAYSAVAGTATFDHGQFDALLRAHVDADGWVDYAGFQRDAAALDAYLAALAAAPYDDLGRDEKLALLLNAYNAFTLRLILDYSPLESIKDIPRDKRWDHVRWQVGPYRWSLNQLEHEEVRPKFNDPRVHFALNCASVGCPPLRNEAYVADRLETQLEEQTRYIHTHDRWARVDPATGDVYLTRLYDWYGGDFEQKAGSVLAFAGQYNSELRALLDSGAAPAVHWLPYSWALNVQPAG